ncbi:MAG: GNAT family N-acetyltransferase [Eggerthia catenaformis]|uniref:GNAT family N-acetyltransferase n=1 Tax=Eggerthia catenaformis TaxID=31973 RepID=UPI003C6EE236
MKQLQLTDYNKIKKYLDMADYEGYNSNFVTMMMWNHEYHIEYEIHEHFCIMLHNYKGIKYFAMPFTTPKYYQEAMDYMLSYSQKHHFTFMIDCAVPSFIKEIKKIYGDRFIFERTRDFDDYVYDKDMLKTLSGKKMQKRRNHYNNFLKEYPNHQYRSLSIDSDFDLILSCLNKWETDKNASESLSSEVYGIMFLLSSNHLLDIKIGGIFIDDDLKAFIIASPLNHSTIQIHVEKADKTIRGLYPAILKEFLDHEYSSYQYVNREEDMGLQNLRISKQRLHPSHMVEKSRVFFNSSYIRLANKNDTNKIKKLWFDHFEDEDSSSTEYVFNYQYNPENTYVISFHHKIISALQIHSLSVSGYKDCYFIYGVVTDQPYQNQGLMKKLMNRVLDDYKDKRLYLQAYHPEIYQSFGFKASHTHQLIQLQKSEYRKESNAIFDNNCDYLSIYMAYCKDYKEYGIRDKKYYHDLKIRLEAYHENIIGFKSNHQDIGYMIYHETEEELYISEFIVLRQLEDILSLISRSFHKEIFIECQNDLNIHVKVKEITAMMCNQESHTPISTRFINEIY